tara:strand:+ start:188 stop:418 length:231 start_codon:yes stop_codon:yes gene_type:complete
MIYSIRKIVFATLFNSSLLIILIIGIQNSTKKEKINLIVNETVELPISFIIGMSFISGSILGSIINANGYLKKNKF